MTKQVALLILFNIQGTETASELLGYMLVIPVSVAKADSLSQFLRHPRKHLHTTLQPISLHLIQPLQLSDSSLADTAWVSLNSQNKNDKLLNYSSQIYS